MNRLSEKNFEALNLLTKIGFNKENRTVIVKYTGKESDENKLKFIKKILETTGGKIINIEKEDLKISNLVTFIFYTNIPFGMLFYKFEHTDKRLEDFEIGLLKENFKIKWTSNGNVALYPKIGWINDEEKAIAISILTTYDFKFYDYKFWITTYMPFEAICY